MNGMRLKYYLARSAKFDIEREESGTEANLTFCLLVLNQDHKPEDYVSMLDIPRPSHADYTYQEKYGIRAASGGGRSSARETIGRVTFL